MAVYKVPQDVEADDKLIGPFSFRQFIYLIVVAISGAAAWGLGTLFIPLAVIPLPLILFFGVLALPLRKDQPMETYLSALLSFYFLKSRRRFWEPDGIESFVTIIAPKNADIKRTKDIDETEAERRFNYLSAVVDSHGWAVRGEDVSAPANLSSELYRETADAVDVLDTDSQRAQNLSRMIDDSSTSRRDEAVAKMQATQPAPAVAAAESTVAPIETAEPSVEPPVVDASQDEVQPVVEPSEATSQTPPAEDQPKKKRYRPKDNSKGYITSDQRDAITYALGRAEEIEEEKAGRVDMPKVDGGSIPPENMTESEATNTSAIPPSAATIDLATNRPELTVETISKEAKRLKEQEQTPADEVFISLH